MQVPKNTGGTRDFGNIEQQKRSYIFKVIRGVFERYGYFPIETPAIENLTTLEGKYGEEGDKLMLKIRSNRKLYDRFPDLKETIGSVYDKPLYMASDRALRYDLTIPFARHVAMKRNDIVFPYKRYQIQPVWRGDRPQKGRYCEFYQCDVDVVGSDSLIYEAEFFLIYNEIFSQLGLDVSIRFNHRKILEGLAVELGVSEAKKSTFIACLDKLGKIGWEGVIEQWKEKEIGFKDFAEVQSVFNHFHTLDEIEAQIDFLTERFSSNSMKEGISDLSEIIAYLSHFGFDCQALHFDLTLSRGLDYYTGTIYEVVDNKVEIGSIGGGGRYDNLTGVFGLKDVSGVGISVGVERVYDVMEELDLFPNTLHGSPRAMLCYFGDKYIKERVELLQALRHEGIPSEMYPKAVPLKKQLKYAALKAIPFVIMLGEEEIVGRYIKLKNMRNGEQKNLSLEETLKEVLR